MAELVTHSPELVVQLVVAAVGQCRGGTSLGRSLAHARSPGLPGDLVQRPVQKDIPGLGWSLDSLLPSPTCFLLHGSFGPSVHRWPVIGKGTWPCVEVRPPLALRPFCPFGSWGSDGDIWRLSSTCGKHRPWAVCGEGMERGREGGADLPGELGPCETLDGVLAPGAAPPAGCDGCLCFRPGSTAVRDGGAQSSTSWTAFASRERAGLLDRWHHLATAPLSVAVSWRFVCRCWPWQAVNTLAEVLSIYELALVPAEEREALRSCRAPLSPIWGAGRPPQ